MSGYLHGNAGAGGGNTFVDTSAIRAFLEKESASNFTPSLFGLAFSETAPNSNDQALKFSYMYADFSVMDWRFDEEQGNYQLWQDHKLESGRYTLTKSEDRGGTGEPIAFENVIFLFTNYVNYRDAFYDINFYDGNTEQRGLLLRDGYLYHIRWSAADYDQPFLFFTIWTESRSS